MRSTGYVVGVDLGGTNMQIGVVDARNRIIGRVSKKTKAAEGMNSVIDRIARGLRQACEEAEVRLADVSAIGIAAAGAIEIPRGIVLEAPNLRWRNAPLRALLQKKLGRPVVVDNDVNGAVWGEYRLGAGRDRGDVLGVWLGTGVGGGLVLNGSLYYGDYFTAGEVGHTVLFPDANKGRRTVEDWCSRTGMSRTILQRLPKYPRSILRKLTDGTGKVTGSKQLARAYRAKDRLAVQVVHEAADLLGVAIANWVTVLAIDTVIMGGGVSEAIGKPLLRRIEKSFRKHVFPDRCRAAKIILTRLTDDAGLLGAALLARDSVTAQVQAQRARKSA